MISIGLDISTHTGIAVLENPHYGPGWAGAKILDLETLTSKKVDLHRADHLWEQIAVIIKEHIRPGMLKRDYMIVIEDYVFMKGRAMQVLFEIGTVIRYNLFNYGFHYLEVPPTSLKKFVTGSGNAKKEQMLKEVYRRWDIDCKTSDEADAIGLACIGLATNDEHSTLNKAETEVMKNLGILGKEVKKRGK